MRPGRCRKSAAQEGGGVSGSGMAFPENLSNPELLPEPWASVSKALTKSEMFGGASLNQQDPGGQNGEGCGNEAQVFVVWCFCSLISAISTHDFHAGPAEAPR